MSGESPIFEFAKMLALEARVIVSARQRGQVIHQGRDIRAAGDEVEVATRSLLAAKLPLVCHVGHGHVVDSNWKVSPQLDVILADTSSAPTLFRSENGTTYYPFESVYAVGEVKSTYQADHISHFVAVVQSMKARLHRAETPPSYIKGLSLGPGLTASTGSWTYRNPLLSFMLFVDSGNFDLDQVRNLYYTTPAEDLPNIIVLLDRGVIINARLMAPIEDVRWKVNALNYHPEFRSEASEGIGDMWCLIEPLNDELRAGASLGLLLTTLMAHLEQCQLMPVPFGQYILPMLMGGAVSIISPTYGSTWTMVEEGEPQE